MQSQYQEKQNKLESDAYIAFLNLQKKRNAETILTARIAAERAKHHKIHCRCCKVG